jgi:hypothetical protein
MNKSETREISVSTDTRILIASKLESLFKLDPKDPKVSVQCQEILDLIPTNPAPSEQRFFFIFSISGFKKAIDFFKSLLPKRETGIGLSPDDESESQEDKIKLVNTYKAYLLRAGNWKLIIEYDAINICEFWNYDDEGESRSLNARPVAGIAYYRTPFGLHYRGHGRYVDQAIRLPILFIEIIFTIRMLKRY